MKRSRRQRERRRSSYTVGLSRETLYQKTSLCGENLRVRRRGEKVGSSETSGRERARGGRREGEKEVGQFSDPRASPREPGRLRAM